MLIPNDRDALERLLRDLCNSQDDISRYNGLDNDRCHKAKKQQDEIKERIITFVDQRVYEDQVPF